MAFIAGNKPKMPTIVLPSWIYANSRIAGKDAVPSEKIWTYEFSHIATTEEGGLYAFYIGTLFPEKFACTPGAMGALNIVKALTVTLMKSVPLRGLQSFLYNYCSMADRVLGPWYLRSDLSCIAVKELRIFTYVFLKNLGVSDSISWRTARIIGTLFEYDTAYRYPLQDLATETYIGKLIIDPRGEIKRLRELYRSREQEEHDGGEGRKHKFLWTMKLLQMVLLIPGIKKAFIAGLRAVTFSNIQFDNGDRYHCMLLGGYNYFGLTIEQRLENYKLIHPDGFPKRIQLG